MGLLDWLFPKAPQSDAEVRWSRSPAGNPTGIYRNRRLTVFEQDGGWKFCDAKVEDDDEPYFSGAYDSVEAAKYEAVAWVGGLPSRHKSRSQRAGERRLREALSGIEGKAALAAEIRQALATGPKLTELRRLDKKVANARRQLTSDVNRAYSMGEDAAKSERLEQELAALVGAIGARIEERKTRPKK